MWTFNTPSRVVGCIYQTYGSIKNDSTVKDERLYWLTPLPLGPQPLSLAE